MKKYAPSKLKQCGISAIKKKSDCLKEEEKKRKLNICSTVCIRLMNSQVHGTGHILFQVIFTYTGCFR